MINYLIPLYATFFKSGLMPYVFYPLMCLGLLYIFPSFVRSLFSWR